MSDLTFGIVIFFILSGLTFNIYNGCEQAKVEREYRSCVVLYLKENVTKSGKTASVYCAAKTGHVVFSDCD